MRKARKRRDYTALRDLGVRAVDEVFKMAAPPLREATDLRENMQVSKSEKMTYYKCLIQVIYPTNTGSSFKFDYLLL